jgi:hypothetical protein
MDHDIMDHPLTVICVMGTGAILFFVNVMLSAREIRQTRVAAPARVQEEEAAKLPAFKPKKSSPWDDEDDALAIELPPES